MIETANLASEILETLTKMDKNHDCNTSKIRAKLIQNFDGEVEVAVEKYDEIKVLKACELLEEEECIRRKNNQLDFIGISFKGEGIVRKGGFMDYLRNHSKFSFLFSDNEEDNDTEFVTQKELLKVVNDHLLRRWL